jgi:hypothetical protein
VPRSVVRDAHERIVPCGLVIVPVTSKAEDKFEDVMEVTASSPLFEIARLLVLFDHVARFVANANHTHHGSAVGFRNRAQAVLYSVCAVLHNFVHFVEFEKT